jgi:ABC-type lipoprotein export system ATPase subunit
MALMVAENLQKHFRRGPHSVEALKGVTLSIDEGEILCIMGRSGSGKTTLLSLLGLLDMPTGGSLCFRGREAGNVSLRERTDLRRSCFGFIFQQFNLISHLTAAENVALPLRYCGVPHGKRMERASAMLERVGLLHRREFFFDELSGGEAQRVALARALINRPAVLCADEPTSELDTVTGEEIMSLMVTMQKELGTTMILVSHDHLVASCATRIVTMEDGMLHG